MDNSDIYSVHDECLKKAAKTPIHHSTISEHFQGDFPLFVNRWEEGFKLREHNHAYLEIVYVMSGKGFHYVGNDIVKTRKGSHCVLPVGTSHLFRPSSATSPNKLLVYNLCIRPEFIGKLTSLLRGYGGGEVLSIYKGEPGTYLSLVDEKMELGRMFELFHREYTEKHCGFEMNLFSGVLHLSVQIYRLLMEAPVSVGFSSTVTNGRTELLRMLNEIQIRFMEPLTVESLAVEAGMSKRNFIRLFRKLTGMGFSEYLKHKRVELACQLLRKTDHTIATISRSIGYRDPSIFGRFFVM